MRQKLSKQAVRYRQARLGTRRCSSCAMFHPRTGTCDVVEGRIRPGDLCDRWVKR